MTSFLKHRLSQVLGSSDETSSPISSRQGAAASKGSDAPTLAIGPLPRRTPSEPGMNKENHSRQSSRGQYTPQSTEPKRSLQEIASSTLKNFSKTLRSKAQYFYTDAERARQASDTDPTNKLSHSRKISTSRLIESFKKHRHSLSGKGRRSHTPQESIETLAKMDPSSVEEHSPSIDVSIPDSALWEPGQRCPWVGSRRGRNLSTRSRGTTIDQSNLWPSPVAIAARRSSIGATTLVNQSNGDSSKGQKPDGDLGPQVSTRERSETASTIPLIQRRLSVYKHFQKSSSTIDLLRDTAGSEAENKSKENVADAAVSMGPRSEWEESRAERQRRYDEVIRIATPGPILREELEHALGHELPKPSKTPQQALRPDSASLKSVCNSESSGSHYESDDDQNPDVKVAGEASDKASRNAPEKSSIGGESWTTSPENAVEGALDAGQDSIEKVLDATSSCSMKIAAIGRDGQNPDTDENGGGVDSPKSQSTTESCAVSTQKPISPALSFEINEHHRTLSVHENDLLEGKLVTVGTCENGEHHENQVAQLTPLPESTDSLVDLDVASVATESTMASLPPLRRTPGTLTNSFFRTNSPTPSESGSEASEESNIVLPAYNNASPKRSVERIICEDKSPAGEAATIEEASTTTSEKRFDIVIESPVDETVSSESSDSSSSVGSWLRSHPDFDGASNLGGLTLNSRTLSAELLRYSYLHGCAPRHDCDGGDSAGFRSEENLALSESHKARTIRPCDTRRSSAQESTLLGTDNGSEDGAFTSSPGRRESLIPIPVNASRLNIMGDVRARTPERVASPPFRPGFAAAGTASRSFEVFPSSDPAEPVKKIVLPAQLHAHRFTTPASDPAPRQVRFPDDTAETLAARATQPSGSTNPDIEVSSGLGADKGLHTSPSARDADELHVANVIACVRYPEHSELFANRPEEAIPPTHPGAQDTSEVEPSPEQALVGSCFPSAFAGPKPRP